jgi:4-amino-4-deoxy-L-arabinose transferase-like glycosyltransferase
MLLSFAADVTRIHDTKDSIYARKYDERQYHDLAVTLLTRHTLDTTYWSPGYILFVSLVYALTGPHPFAVYLMQSIMFGFTLLLIYAIALRVTQDHTASLVALVLCGMWLPFYESNAVVLTETLSGLLLALALWLLVRTEKGLTNGSSILAGLVLGALSVVKPAALPLALAMAVVVGFKLSGQRLQLAKCILVLCACGTVIAPMTIRNYRLMNAVVPISTGGGFNFWYGNYPPSYSKPFVADRALRPFKQKLVGLSDAEKDKVYIRQGLKNMAADPSMAIMMLVHKFSTLWFHGLGWNPDATNGYKGFRIGHFGVPRYSWVCVPMFFLAAFGWLSLPAEQKRQARPVATAMLMWTLVYVAVTAEPRYILPVQYYEMILVGYAISRLRARRQLAGKLVEEARA